jgi:Uma2 family endonuclease
MVALPNPRWTEADYLAFERGSEERHEFIDGYVVAMSGASRQHNRTVGNAFVSLHNSPMSHYGCVVNLGNNCSVQT